MGVTAVDLLSFAITTVFPDLIASDMERLKEIASDDDAGANAFLNFSIRIVILLALAGDKRKFFKG